MLIGIISKFPPRNKKHTKDGAVAGYTKNLACSLPYKDGITVYADILADFPESDYFDERVRVKRVWKRGALFPSAILSKVFRDRPDIVHVQHEFFLYGGGASSIAFLALLLGLRLLKIPTVVTVHGVVPLSSIDSAFVRENRSILPAFLVKAGFLAVIKGIGRLSNLVIVHEEKFSKIIRQEYGCNVQSSVVPLGIEPGCVVPNGHARKALKVDEGKKVLLFFGYMTAYKGIELLLDAFALLDSSYVLIIAGGRHPRLKDYVESLMRKAEAVSPDRILFTDFVPEQDISTYFSAADLVIFPYTIGMASSASMSTAISYGRPFIVSEAFSDVVDLKEAVFGKDPKELAGKVEGFFRDEKIRQDITWLSSRLKEDRSWERVGELTYGIYRRLASVAGPPKGKLAKQEV